MHAHKKPGDDQPVIEDNAILLKAAQNAKMLVLIFGKGI
jgi:hypothetical protein